MGAREAKIYLVGALVTFAVGLFIVLTGHTIGWVLAAVGTFNAAVAIYRLRKAAPPLN
jgi:hypothetical protein